MTLEDVFQEIQTLKYEMSNVEEKIRGMTKRLDSLEQQGGRKADILGIGQEGLDRISRIGTVADTKKYVICGVSNNLHKNGAGIVIWLAGTTVIKRKWGAEEIKEWTATQEKSEAMKFDWWEVVPGKKESEDPMRNASLMMHLLREQGVLDKFDLTVEETR